MPRVLVLDWDQDRCHILAGNVTRSGIKVERGLAWAQEEVLNQGQGDEAGKRLKDFLKSANLASAPLLVCLPKQRVLLKELRCPSVAADEEPALVRFQATKEMLENPEDVVLDYAHISRLVTESVILVAAMRKDLLAGYHALAKSAGLKLAGLTPRAFVLGNLLARSRKIDPLPTGTPPEWSAVLLLGRSWAELTILHGRTVCFSRSLTNDESLESEIRRSLVMFASQLQGHAPQILYLFGQDASQPLQERLSQGLRIPVTCPKVLADDDVVNPDVNCPAGVGLLSAWTEEKLEVNFIRPKEPKPPAPGNKRAWLLAAGGGVVVLAFFMLLSQQMLAAMRDQIADAKGKKDNTEKLLKSFEQDRLDMDALDEWEQGSIPWIDELYDITARLPFEPPGFHLTKLDGNVLARRNPKEKDKFQARVVLNGVDGTGRRESFQDDLLLDSLQNEHLRLTPGLTTANRFTINLDLAGQSAQSYLARLELPKKYAPPARKKAP